MSKKISAQNLSKQEEAYLSDQESFCDESILISQENQNLTEKQQFSSETIEKMENLNHLNFAQCFDIKKQKCLQLEFQSLIIDEKEENMENNKLWMASKRIKRKSKKKANTSEVEKVKIQKAVKWNNFENQIYEEYLNLNMENQQNKRSKKYFKEMSKFMKLKGVDRDCNQCRSHNQKFEERTFKKLAEAQKNPGNFQFQSFLNYPSTSQSIFSCESTMNPQRNADQFVGYGQETYIPGLSFNPQLQVPNLNQINENINFTQILENHQSIIKLTEDFERKINNVPIQSEKNRIISEFKFQMSMNELGFNYFKYQLIELNQIALNYL